MTLPPRWHAVANADELRWRARAFVAAAADDAIRARGAFSVVLAGGQTPRALYRSLRDLPADWERWQVYFGDERCLPADDPERNSRMAAAAWLDHVAVLRANIHTIPAECGAERAAVRYRRMLAGVGDFDLVLLGLGEDGHTASLFPDQPWGEGVGAPDALAVSSAPKPPRERVSLSAARLGRARRVLFLVVGDGKRGAVQAWRAGQSIPPRAITPPGGVDVLVEARLLR
jgi:6-phosphogluconolactonase